jgi:hypothetical protein
VLNELSTTPWLTGEWNYIPPRFLVLALDGGGWLTSRPGRFTLQGKEPMYLLCRTLCGLQNWSLRSGTQKKYSPAPNWTPAFQPVARHYAYWAIPTPKNNNDVTVIFIINYVNYGLLFLFSPYGTKGMFLLGLCHESKRCSMYLHRKCPLFSSNFKDWSLGLLKFTTNFWNNEPVYQIWHTFLDDGSADLKTTACGTMRT